MAKGDAGRVQNAVDYRGNTALANNNNLRDANTTLRQGTENRYNVSADQSNQDYLNNSRAASGLLNNIASAPTRDFGSYGGYQDFAKTGGYSPTDVSAIRERGIAPIRAMYANAKADMDRHQALTGNSSPNYGAALAKMTREGAIAAGDQSTNVEASLANQIRQGKLSGLSGMTGIDSEMNSLMNQRLGLGNQAFGNMISNYSATPGQTNMYGNQLNNSVGNQSQNQQFENQLMQMIISGQLGRANVPGNGQQALGNISKGIDMGSKIAGLFA